MLKQFSLDFRRKKGEKKGGTCCDTVVVSAEKKTRKKGVFSVYFPSFSTVLDGGKIISLSILAVSGLNDPPLFLANDILSALFLPLMVFFSEKEISRFSRITLGHYIDAQSEKRNLFFSSLVGNVCEVVKMGRRRKKTRV